MYVKLNQVQTSKSPHDCYSVWLSRLFLHGGGKRFGDFGLRALKSMLTNFAGIS